MGRLENGSKLPHSKTAVYSPPMKRKIQPAAGRPVFAVAGNPPNFFASPHGKDRLNGPAWLREIGLDGLEISCTHGVNISAERAADYRRNAQAAGIRLFVHAPYYIALASGDPAIVEQQQAAHHRLDAQSPCRPGRHASSFTPAATRTRAPADAPRRWPG